MRNGKRPGGRVETLESRVCLSSPGWTDGIGGGFAAHASGSQATSPLPAPFVTAARHAVGEGMNSLASRRLGDGPPRPDARLAAYAPREHDAVRAGQGQPRSASERGPAARVQGDLSASHVVWSEQVFLNGQLVFSISGFSGQGKGPLVDGFKGPGPGGHFVGDAVGGAWFPPPLVGKPSLAPPGDAMVVTGDPVPTAGNVSYRIADGPIARPAMPDRTTELATPAASSPAQGAEVVRSESGASEILQAAATVAANSGERVGADALTASSRSGVSWSLMDLEPAGRGVGRSLWSAMAGWGAAFTVAPRSAGDNASATMASIAAAASGKILDQAQAALAETIGSVLGATAGAEPATTTVALEFAHLGSPFALLADSVAAFIDDSASIPLAAAGGVDAPSGGPWTLTFAVLAADVILLTYLHRRRSGSGGGRGKSGGRETSTA